MEDSNSPLGTPQSDINVQAYPNLAPNYVNSLPPSDSAIMPTIGQGQLAPAGPQGVPMAPLDPMKNIGGQGDVLSTIQQVNAASPAPKAPAAGESPDQFATADGVPTPVPQAADLSPEAKGLLNTFADREKANAALANAQQDKAVLDAKTNETMAAQMEAQQAVIAKKQSEFETNFADKTKYLDKVADELKSQDFTAAKVNGKRFWEHQSTGGKIMAGLAVALGGIGGALTGKGDNVGLDMVNKAIDRDIDEQKFNIDRGMEAQKMKSANLSQQASLGNNMLQEMRAKFQSDIAGETATRLLMVQQAQYKLSAIASGYESASVKEKAKYANAELEQQKLGLQMTLKQQLAQQQAMKSMMTDDLSQLTPMQMQQMGMSKETQESIIKTQERSVSGFEGITPDKESAAKFREKAGELIPGIAAIDRVMALRKDFNRFTDLATRAKIGAEIQGLIGKMRIPYTGPGILSPDEYKRMLKIIGDPNTIIAWTPAQEASMNQVKIKLQSDLSSDAKLFGLRQKPNKMQKYLTPVK
jgi:hypothetical protein